MRVTMAGWVGRVRALCATLIIGLWRPPVPWHAVLPLAILLVALLACGAALAHSVTESDASYVQQVTGYRPIAFFYLGAKHMVTGCDHLLFLAGVIILLYRAKDIAAFVSRFAIGHSVTMIAGV